MVQKLVPGRTPGSGWTIKMAVVTHKASIVAHRPQLEWRERVLVC